MAIRFDLREIIEKKLISTKNIDNIKAELSLYTLLVSNPDIDGEVCSLFVASENWNIDEITWLERKKGSKWKHKGGDFDRRNLITAPFAEKEQWETFDVSKHVRNCLKGRIENRGFILAPDRGQSNPARHYSSSEATDKKLRPKLTISYSNSLVIIKNKTIPFSIKQKKQYLLLNDIGQKIQAITMENLQGKILYHTASPRNTHKISTEGIPNGVYFIRIKSKEMKLLTQRILIQ